MMGRYTTAFLLTSLQVDDILIIVNILAFFRKFSNKMIIY